MREGWPTAEEKQKSNTDISIKKRSEKPLLLLAEDLDTGYGEGYSARVHEFPKRKSLSESSAF